MTTSKPRVMVMSDHSALHTGFANVARHILNYIYDTGKYEVAEFGWFAPRPRDVQDRMPRWRVYTTDRSNPAIGEQDKYGHVTLGSAVADFKPHVLLSIGDTWMVDHVAKVRDAYGFVWTCYCPIDSLPVPIWWAQTFRAADILVAYGKWGANVMRQRAPELKPEYIYHGVDAHVYKPNPVGRAAIRKAMGLDDSHFLIGSVGRNQPRKQFPLLFKAFAMWSKLHNTCPDTGKPFIVGYDEFYINELVHPPTSMPHMDVARRSAREGTGDVSPFTGKPVDPAGRKQRDNARLYLHCALDDVGWDLHEQVGRYRLRDKVILRDDLKVAAGVTDAELANIYNAFDVFSLPTMGEGWGLPTAEAMACGVPICITDYSAHTEWARPAGEFVKPITFYTEPITSAERALCDPTDYVACLDRLYEDPSLRKRYGANGRFIAERMDWTTCICPRWVELIDRAVGMWRQPTEKPADLTVEVV